MTKNAKAPRLPAGITEALSPAEQAHMDSAGEDALAADTGADTAPGGDAGGADTQPAGGGADSVEGGQGGDTIDGAQGADSIAGAADGDGKPKMVPHAAMHEEREARKAAEKRATMLEERTNLILEALRNGTLGGGQQAQQQAPAAPAEDKGPDLLTVPDFDTDPRGHFEARLVNGERVREHEAKRTNEIVTTIAQLLVGQHQQGEQQSVAQARWNRSAAAEREFAAATPDYNDAMGHLKGARLAHYAAQGITDPAQQERALAAELHKVAEFAESLGSNVAQLLYANALASGYQKKAPAAQQQGAPAGTRIATAQRGQQQNGPGPVRGAATPGLTANKLLEMSDAEFARAIATPEGRALLGA